MSDMVNVTICDGKYTIVQDSDGRTRIDRYGQPWRDATGDNVVFGAAYEIESLRSENNRLKERVKRLEGAGNELAMVHLMVVRTYEQAKLDVEEWRKAKEAA